MLFWGWFYFEQDLIAFTVLYSRYTMLQNKTALHTTR